MSESINNMPHHEYKSIPRRFPALFQQITSKEVEELRKYKEAVLWLHSQSGHDLCHENIRDLFNKCGLPPKELGLPSREEFRQRCMKYEEEVYTSEAEVGHINRHSLPKMLKQLEKACGKAVFDMNSPEDMERMKECDDGY